MDRKLGKYYRKLLSCNSKSKYDRYIKKIISYNSTQSGGGDDLDTNIAAYVGDIVSNNYRLITDLKLINDISYQLDHCKDDFFGEFDPGDTIEYKDDFKFNCFMRPLAYSDELIAKEAGYIFKKNFSLSFTDIYMQKGLNRDDLIISTNYFYYILKYALDTYKETIIKSRMFGSKTEYLHDNIYLLYKGGNTTRMIFNSFINSAKTQLAGKNGQTIETTVNNLNDLIENYNIGDWDYNIKINFEELKDNGFNDTELNRIIKHIMQVYVYIASYIKNKIALLLKSSINIDNTARNIQNYLYSNETKENIRKFIETYNKYSKNEKNIESIDIQKTYTFDKIIESDVIHDMSVDDYDMINRNSFIFKKTSDIKGDAEKGYGTISYYVESDTPLINTKKQNIIPEFIKKDSVYFAYLSDLEFVKRYGMPSFNLIRIKANNTIEIVINKNKNDERIKNLHVNLELIDISVSNIYDSKGLFFSMYYYPNYIELIDCKIKNPMFKENQIIIPMPSPHMMFTDICSMLFIENQFIWEDPKYAKRNKRLFFLSLPCMYQDGLQTNEIITIYEKTKALFMQMLDPTLDIFHRLDSLNGEFDIIISPINDKLTNNINHHVSLAFQTLNIIHRIVKIKETSQYAQCRYLEFLIANYIKMLIVADYIVNNIANNDHYDLIQYELLIHRIIELKNVRDYINPNMMTTPTKTLSTIYNEVRGTGHSIQGNDLLPKGPLPGLGQPNNDAVVKFMDKLKLYERTIVEQCDFTLNILYGFRDANIQSINTVYESESLF